MRAGHGARLDVTGTAATYKRRIQDKIHVQGTGTDAGGVYGKNTWTRCGDRAQGQFPCLLVFLQP